ncbi:hypothetical protein D0860_01962 [Hortaea werneckii]|uniref:LITAF domain-containing protein n=1 Tax=Hortaea werneckii TaxID=91943 RepID=A0A3M7HP08_HORWE|nr:hypothetical protein D0860_01962 [Hortaea werneckii]
MSSETHQQDASHGIIQAPAGDQQESTINKGDAMAEPANSPPSYTEAAKDAPVQQHPPQQPMPPQQQPMPQQAIPQQPMSTPYPTQQPMNPNASPVTPLDRLGIGPGWIDCPFCHRRTRTRNTSILAVLFCFICICLTCIPCLAHWFADVDHYCSECGKQVTHQPHDGYVEVLGGGGEYGPPLPATVPSRYAQASDMEMGVGNGQPAAGGGGGQQNVVQKPAPAH